MVDASEDCLRRRMKLKQNPHGTSHNMASLFANPYPNSNYDYDYYGEPPQAVSSPSTSVSVASSIDDSTIEASNRCDYFLSTLFY
jgi:hypothetical protein